MDRQNPSHFASRVELPTSLRMPEIVQALERFYRRLTPTAGLYVGVAGFLGCGAAIIATASFIALRIQ